MQWETVDLKALSADVLETLRAAAEKRKIRMELVGETVTVDGVYRLLHETVYNLCDNAVKYNREGGIVTVTAAETAAGATLTVSDTGIGIPYAEQGRVFERFYRVDKSHSKELGGTGLGLSIVKHAAQYLGASVTLDSTPGEGTAVTLTFPQRAQKKETRESAPDPQNGSGALCTAQGKTQHSSGCFAEILCRRTSAKNCLRFF